jgi:MerR family mercuric resistance operon transcriptional regulator
MTIATLAREGGVGVETVRYSQRRGLIIEPERPAGAGLSGGVHRYGDDDVRRRRFIRSARAAGSRWIERPASCSSLMIPTTGPVLRQAMARRRVESLEVRIAELMAARTALARLADRCASSGAGPCPIMTAFES